MWIRKKNSIEDCWEQFSMLSIKKICKTHISHIDNSILAYLFLYVNTKIKGRRS